MYEPGFIKDFRLRHFLYLDANLHPKNPINWKEWAYFSFRCDHFPQAYFFLLFFLPLLGTFWPAWILIFLDMIWRSRDLNQLRSIVKEEWFWLAGFGAILSVKLFNTDLVNILTHSRQIIGLYFFFIYFRYFNLLKMEAWLMRLSILIITVQIIFHLDRNIYEWTRGELFKSPYARPEGLSQVPSITSVILVSYFITFREYFSKMLRNATLVVLFACGSGVGYFGLFSFWIKSLLSSSRWTTQNKTKLYLWLSGLASTYFVFFSLLGDSIYSGSTIYKISPKYITYLAHLKFDEILRFFLQSTPFEILTGNSWIGFSHFGSDLGWSDQLLMIGVLGSAFYLAFLSRIFKNRFLLFFLIASSFHYGFFEWPAGQIFLGYLAARLNSKTWIAC